MTSTSHLFKIVGHGQCRRSSPTNSYAFFEMSKKTLPAFNLAEINQCLHDYPAGVIVSHGLQAKVCAEEHHYRQPIRAGEHGGKNCLNLRHDFGFGEAVFACKRKNYSLHEIVIRSVPLNK